MSINSIMARCVMVITAMTLPNQLSTAQIVSVVDRDEFIRELDRLVPAQLDGIITTYEAQERRAGISSAGYDARSGAWFIVTQTGCAGMDANGFRYRADEGDKELSDMQPYFAELISIAEEIPWCYLIAMKAQPEMVVGAELDSDGVWNVLYHAIEPARIEDGRAPWLLRIDAETGHVLSKRWTVSDESPAVEFDWTGTTVGLRVKSRNSVTRVRTFLDDHADLGEFEPERVFQRMKEYRIKVDQKLTALSSGYIQSDEGEWVIDEENQPPTQPFNDPMTRRFRMPLIVGGGLVFLIGIAQLIRKGRSQ